MLTLLKMLYLSVHLHTNSMCRAVLQKKHQMHAIPKYQHLSMFFVKNGFELRNITPYQASFFFFLRNIKAIYQ